MIGVLNAVLAAVIAASVGFQLGSGVPGALLLALAGFVIVAAGEARYARREITRGQAELRPIFPTPTTEDQKASR